MTIQSPFDLAAKYRMVPLSRSGVKGRVLGHGPNLRG